jgi:hypothetical protein
MTEAQTTDAEFWHVQLPSGEVRYYSLEELDEAFQRDEIDAKTFVLKQGETTWERLGALLGLDEDEAESPVAAAPAVATPAVVIASVTPPPVSIITPAPASFGDGAMSLRPMVSDLSDIGGLDDDDLAAAMKPKRKNMAFIGGGVALALILGVVGITKASSGSAESTAAAAAAPPPAVVAPVAEPAPVVAPQATLSDDMKKSLLEADKAREAKMAEKSAARAAESAKYHVKSASYRTPSTGKVFHKGGNKYDPLNSAL